MTARSVITGLGAIVVAAAVVWAATGAATFGPNGNGSRSDLPFEFWLLAVAAGVLAGGTVLAVFRRR